MDENTNTQVPSESEIQAANEQARAFLEQIKAVPQDQRNYIDSDKFSDPIATTIVEAAESDTFSNLDK